MREAIAVGERHRAAIAAFHWARSLASAVVKPVAVDVESVRHTVRYWVVAVDWYDWSGGGQVEPRSAHLARAWVAPGGVDYRRAGLVGTHPQHAGPRVRSQEEAPLSLLGESQLDRIAIETVAVEHAFWTIQADLGR
jgi:hypothetical protein